MLLSRLQAGVDTAFTFDRPLLGSGAPRWPAANRGRANGIGRGDAKGAFKAALLGRPAARRPALAVLAGALSAGRGGAGERIGPASSAWCRRCRPDVGGSPLDGAAGAERSPEIVGPARELASVELLPGRDGGQGEGLAGAIAQDQRVAGLSQLFVVSLADLNLQRDRLIAAIRQHHAPAAARGTDRDETRELDAAQRAASPDATRIAELQASRDWDLRVHTDRQRSLREVCDQPGAGGRAARLRGGARILEGELP
ncbi:MAG: hypothetical protein U1E17_14800 [Geminicoccaceae bacterium]